MNAGATPSATYAFISSGVPRPVTMTLPFHFGVATTWAAARMPTVVGEMMPLRFGYFSSRPSVTWGAGGGDDPDLARVVQFLGQEIDLAGPDLGRGCLVDKEVTAARRVRVVGDHCDALLHRLVQRRAQGAGVGRRHDQDVGALRDRRLDGRNLRRGCGGRPAGLGAALAKRGERGDRTPGLGTVGGGEVVVAEVLRDDE